VEQAMRFVREMEHAPEATALVQLFA